MNDRRDDPVFDISPEVVFRLGDELITDELQALVELVKNSYDASATIADVYVDTTAEPLAGHPDDATGWLEIRDDGDGMTRDQLDHGWLLISASGKRDMKRQGRTNRLGRTPLGDKGLGRLGVLRLGRRVEIRTRPRGVHEEHILSFDRTDFEREEALSNIDLHYERGTIGPDEAAYGGWRVTTPYRQDVTCGAVPGPQGTVIRISGLNNPEVWQDRVGVQREMLALISPFAEIEKFSLSVTLADDRGSHELDLGRLADVRRDLADARWTFTFDGKRLSAEGRFKLGAFQPAKTNDTLAPFWAENVEPDRGAEYRRRLAEGPLASNGPHAPGGPWWLGVRLSVDAADVVVASGRHRKHLASPDDEVPFESPGQFTGEIDSFSLGRDVDLAVGGEVLFDSLEVYRRWVQDVRGIKVFRDGFGIRVGDDFLGLGVGSTSGRSFYALRPGNVVGFVALSAAKNQQLQETTDREGFVANAAYRTFSTLLRTLVDRINIVQTQIGRELSTWQGQSGQATRPTPSRRAAELAREAADRETRTRETVAAVTSVRRTLQELGDGSALLTPDQAQEARRAGELLDRLRSLMEEGETLRRDLDELAAASKEVEQERAQLRDQLRVAYQTVGLGLVAETVAHEMMNITGRLQAEADALAPQFKGAQQRAARALVSEIKATVRAIRLQLRHLEPQLRYQRMRREALDARAAVDRVADYHRTRLEPAGVAVHVDGTGFIVRVNRGRMQQALDNLLINSAFWLAHARTPDPRIDLVLDAPLITVRDNGPGVDPGIETAIFEPFVSGRTGEQGRGLGLFIARQVLHDDGATIHLGDRDRDGRRRTFVLDFSGAIEEPTDG